MVGCSCWSECVGCTHGAGVVRLAEIHTAAPCTDGPLQKHMDPVPHISYSWFTHALVFMTGLIT